TMKRTQRFKHLRATGSTAEFCCVPFCPMTSRYNRVLSFFHFPSNLELRQQWIVAVRRENLIIKAHTRVCSRHFKLRDIKEPASNGKRRLKCGAVPVLFEWNNYSLPFLEPAVVDLVLENNILRSLEKVAVDVLKEHNYASVPEAAVVDLVLENNILRKEIHQTQEQIGSLMLKQRFGIHHFASSNKDIRFFTSRFASYDHLMRFWALIEPFLPTMISVQQNIDTTPSTHSLQPIDEFFLFLNFLALGSKQQDLADQYGVHQSSVIQITTTWSNFLFTVHGSIRIWIPENQIHKNLPRDFEDYPDTTVIIDSIALRCQCPSSPLLQSEVSSFYKSRCTLVPCKIYRPEFLSGGPQMPVGEVRKTEAIAGLRVHVECLVRRVKEHKLFDPEIPLGVFGIVNQLYTVACLLTNYEH
uniref:THAP-type domain-containing protein n=1 Tax=Poecilia formosa TaxID=48698 RepID=A0A087XGT2_POEFO